MTSTSGNNWLCKSWVDEYRPSAFVILLNCSNLAVIIILKATAKQALGILIPQQHKCADVVGNFMTASKLFLAIIFVTLSFSTTAQKWNAVYTDTNCYAIHTTTIASKKYVGFLNDQTFYLLNAKGDTALKKSDFYFDWEFKDFNKDGYSDVMLTYSSNTPSVLDLFLYVPATGKFKEIKKFREFPAPEQIKGTKFYYSYHKSGCADMNWDSDLFYIENYKAVRIGNIAGRQCDNRDGVKDAVYIHKVHGDEERLFKTLPIDTILKYKDFKWGFIQEYWTKNYKLFI